MDNKNVNIEPVKMFAEAVKIFKAVKAFFVHMH